MKNEDLLSILEDKIELLSAQCVSFSHVKMPKPCFDAQLFHYQSVLLEGYQPYLTELKHNYQKLVLLIDKDHDNSHFEQIIFLAELIVNQINALQREIATHQLREIEQISDQHDTLQEQYAKNVGYLKRLEGMKYQLEQSPSINDVSTKTQLHTLDNRIARCRYTLSTIEQKIEQSSLSKYS